MMQQRIVVTGGIACGKSTAVARLAELGVPVVSADLVARAIVAPGEAGHEALKQLLDTSFFQTDGTLNRAKLRRAIFTNPQLKQNVEHTLHPMIRKTMLTQATHCSAPYVVLDIPLYAESEARVECDAVWVVDCPHDIQLHRLMQRDAIDEELAKKMIAAQASREKRLALASQVIDNSGSLKDLIAQVDALHAKTLTHLAESL